METAALSGSVKVPPLGMESNCTATWRKKCAQVTVCVRLLKANAAVTRAGRAAAASPRNATTIAQEMARAWRSLASAAVKQGITGLHVRSRSAQAIVVASAAAVTGCLASAYAALDSLVPNATKLQPAMRGRPPIRNGLSGRRDGPNALMAG